MKGVVFNLLEEVVRKHHGEDGWDSILDSTSLSGSFTSLGNYPDQSLMKLVCATARSLATTDQNALRWFGREAMAVMSKRYPAFFPENGTARDFVLAVNDIIHPEVRKIYPGADVPEFDFSDAPDGALLMGYVSHRKLCALAEGFVEGAGDYYCEEVDFQHLTCMHKGDEKCSFRIKFAPRSVA